MNFEEFKETETYKQATQRLYTINADDKDTYCVEHIMDKNHMLDDAIVIGTGHHPNGILQIDLILQ